MTKLIAEIGWNHLGNVSLAKKMILATWNHILKFALFGQILIYEMPKFLTKNPNFTKNIINRLNTCVY